MRQRGRAIIRFAAYSNASHSGTESPVHRANRIRTAREPCTPPPLPVAHPRRATLASTPERGKIVGLRPVTGERRS
jgi:hypothetical protein